MKQKYTIMIADVQMNIVTDETPENVEAIVGILDRRIREIYLQSGNRCPKNEAALLCALDYCAERNRLQETVNKLEEEKKNNDSDALRAEVARLAEECDETRARLAVSEEKFRNANADANIAGEQIRILTQKAVSAETNANELSARVKELEQKLAEVTAELAEKESEIASLKASPAPVATPDAPDAEATDSPAAEPIAEVETNVAEETTAAFAAEEPVPAAEIPAEEKPAEKAPVSEIADSVDTSFEIELKPLRRPIDENQLTIDSRPAEEAQPAVDAKPVEEKPAEPEKNLSDAATMEKEKQKAQKRVRSMFDLITFDNV